MPASAAENAIGSGWTLIERSREPLLDARRLVADGEASGVAVATHQRAEA
jgi:hypothetical protein